jgi:hypothetical protein
MLTAEGFLFSTWSWKLVSDWGKCRWSMELSVTLNRRYWHQQFGCALQEGIYINLLAKLEGQNHSGNTEVDVKVISW